MRLTEIGLRILVAAILGALIGLDRELSDQPAGLRTHILVSIGATLFTMAGAYGFVGISGSPVDPSRVAAQIVTGIGFLGAGAILRQGTTVRGLTTAAGLWVTAAVGLAVGLGYWGGAVITTVVGVVSLFGLKRVERRLLRRLKPGRYEFVIDASPGLHLSHITKTVEEQRCKIDSVKMDIGEEDKRHVVIFLRLPPRVSPGEIADVLQSIEGVVNVDWTR